MAGTLTLADYPTDLVHIACQRCDRRGQYRRAALIARYGEKALLPDLLARLTRDCPMRSMTRNKACGAYFLDLIERQLTRPPARTTGLPSARGPKGSDREGPPKSRRQPRRHGD